jgi:pyruvate, water dikinase
MDYILDFMYLNISSHSHVGGKNANMGELIKAGIRVPPGYAITTDAYLNFIIETGIKSGISDMLACLNPDDINSVNRVSIELQKLIKSIPISGEILDSIKSGYSRLCEKYLTDTVPVAVRSSATVEDLPAASFAGQFDTYLWVKSPDRIVEKVQQCWASLFTPRAIDYRIKNNIPHEKVLMSVSIQKMVNSRSAGVMFTINPTNGDPSKVVIEGNWGLGETVVLGSVNPDRIVIDKVIKEIEEKKVFLKHIECVYDPDTGEVVNADLPDEMQSKCCLEEDEIFELFDIAKTIETHYGRPMDIEWAIDRDFDFPENIFIVQARPETVWSQRQVKPIVVGKPLMEWLFEKTEQHPSMKGIKIPRTFL